MVIRQPLEKAKISQLFGKEFKAFNWTTREYYDFYASYGLKGHPGIDYSCGIGTPVYSTHDGVVMYTGYDDTNGNLVQIWNEQDGYKTLYGHNSEFKVKQGDKVKAGDIISLSGNTGAGTGPHLHFGLKMTGWGGNSIDINNGYNGAIDPMPYITQDYLGNNLKKNMTFKKEKEQPHIYLVNENKKTKTMIVDFPTLEVFDDKYEVVDSLTEYTNNGTMVWVDRIID